MTRKMSAYTSSAPAQTSPTTDSNFTEALKTATLAQPYEWPTGSVRTEARNALRPLLTEQGLSRSLFSFRNFKAIFVKQDRALLNAFMQELVEFLNETVVLPAPAPAVRPQQPDPREALVGHVISLLTQGEPETNQIIALPQKINGHWKMIPHRAIRIEMNPASGRSAYNAVGFEPQTDTDQAKRILAFKGTTPIATSPGALETLIADTNFGSVGAALFATGKDNLQRWLNVAPNDTVIAVGQSLGGSLAMHACCHWPDKIKAMVYNPAALWKRDKKVLEANLAKLDTKTRQTVSSEHLKIFVQDGCPVQIFGDWLPEYGKRYRVFPPSSYRPPFLGASAAAHAKLFCTMPGATFKQLNKGDFYKEKLARGLRVWFRYLTTPLAQFLLFIAQLVSAILYPFVYYASLFFKACWPAKKTQATTLDPILPSSPQAESAAESISHEAETKQTFSGEKKPRGRSLHRVPHQPPQIDGAESPSQSKVPEPSRPSTK